MNVVLKRTVLSSLIVMSVAATSFVMGHGAVQAPADNSGLPEGNGKKIVVDNCTGCHDLDMVKSAKHDLAAWTETLNHMVTYGASITDAQIPTVAAYLAKSFPVQATPPAGTPPAATPPAAQKPDEKKEDPDVVGERILNTACTTCHDLGPVTRRADERSSWEGIVYGMVGNGADVKDADIPVLVDYLFKFYGPKAPAAPAAPAGRGARGQ